MNKKTLSRDFKLATKVYTPLRQNSITSASSEALCITPISSVSFPAASSVKQYLTDNIVFEKQIKAKWVRSPARVFSELCGIVATDITVPRGILISEEGNFVVPFYYNQKVSHIETFCSFLSAVEYINTWLKSQKS